MAESFKALGAGNGFPSCLSKVDVSGYDHFAALSLREAMSLFWNLFGFQNASFTSSLSKSDTRSGGLNYSFTKNGSGSSVMSPEPKGRTCGARSLNPSSFSEQFTEEELNETDGASCGGSASFSIPILRAMYNGDINNESNFVGYGIPRLYSASTNFFHLDGLLDGSASIIIGSYMDGESGSGSTEDPPDSGNFNYFNKTASTVSIGGITFRSFASAFVNTSNSESISRTVQSSASSAYAFGKFIFTREDGTIVSSIGSAGVSTPSISFHSY